jgi:hypothetical protein
MSGAQDIDWLVAGALIAPVIAWTAWEMFQAWRERREIRRLMRENKGDGLP